MIRGWNAKVGRQEIPGVSGKFGLGVQNEATQEMTLNMDIIRWSVSKSD